MKKILISIYLVLILFLNAAKITSADNLVAESSATIAEKDGAVYDYKVSVLKDYLAKNNSPLAPFAEYFIKAAQDYELDWRLIPAISGVESTYGKNIPLNSYNAYGWANGNYSFDSWEESISTVAEALRNKYLNRGYITISQIARIYAPPSQTWAGKVKYIMNKIDPLPLAYTI